MKKILLATALMGTLFTTNAGNLYVGYSTEWNGSSTEYTEINDGDLINIWGPQDIDEGYEYELPCYIKIANQGTTSLNVTATLEEVTEESVLDVPTGISFCLLGNCLAGWTNSATLAAGESYSGYAEHIAYVFANEDESIVEINSEEYTKGPWVGKFTVRGGLEIISCKLYFSVNKIDNLGGVKGVSVDASDAPATYYDLQGRIVENPASGLNIKVQGGKATKIKF
ncbi:MAG: hypothetical protein LUC85_06230 [Bacteroidales bacterium]|nr:hypothetical protein [Bacteroidales bacterium]MCD8394416.1 hypothetical protein [Bacteroidales bacterium]